MISPREWPRLRRNILKNAEWNVPKATGLFVSLEDSVDIASDASKRRCISVAAAFEYVITSTGEAALCDNFIARAVITAVFPLPGPANTIIGPSKCDAAFC